MPRWLLLLNIHSLLVNSFWESLMLIQNHSIIQQDNNDLTDWWKQIKISSVVPRNRCGHAVLGFQWPWCIYINERYQVFKAFWFSELNRNQHYDSYDCSASLLLASDKEWSYCEKLSKSRIFSPDIDSITSKTLILFMNEMQGCRHLEAVGGATGSYQLFQLSMLPTPHVYLHFEIMSWSWLENIVEGKEWLSEENGGHCQDLYLYTEKKM